MGGEKWLEISGRMGNQKRTGRWEIRNARNAGIKKQKKKIKGMKGLKGNRKNKKGWKHCNR